LIKGSQRHLFVYIQREHLREIPWQVIPMADEKPSEWYWASAVPVDHLPPDGKPYFSEPPGEPDQCFILDGYLCFTYIKDGTTKAIRFEAPDRFFPMDPWLLEWGDLGGVCYPQLVSRYSFSLRIGLQQAAHDDRVKAKAHVKPKKAVRKRTPGR
jgi:hypothetical protein